MSSGYHSFPYDYGTDRRSENRRDSSDSTRNLPPRGYITKNFTRQIKCRNFDAAGKRLGPCVENCPYVHPSEPEWETAVTSRRKGTMGPPAASYRPRDPPRDSGWPKAPSSRSTAGGHSSRSSDNDAPKTPGWGKDIDTSLFRSTSASTSAHRETGWDSGWGLPQSAPAVSEGWGSPVRNRESTATPVATANNLQVDRGSAGTTNTQPVKEYDLRPSSSIPSVPKIGLTKKEPVPQPELSPRLAETSSGKAHSRGSSMDIDKSDGNDNDTPAVVRSQPAEKLAKTSATEGAKGAAAVSPPTIPTLPPLARAENTSVPALKVVLPTLALEHQNSAVSLALQSPFVQSAQSTPIHGSATMRTPEQLAWNGHIEALSRAVTAQLKRMQLKNTLDDRQRLISRINQKSSRPNVANIPNTLQENVAQDADEKIRTTVAALSMTNGEAEQVWWPTPRGGIDYEKALASLERDIENLQQLLGEPPMKNDEMGVNMPNEVDLEKLRKRRQSVFRDVQNTLAYTKERLRTTASYVTNQQEGLESRVSHILHESHPPNPMPGAERLAKLEDMQERFRKLESRMANYLPDLRTRRDLGAQRSRDLNTLKTRYEELRQNERMLADRKRKLTKEVKEFIADSAHKPTIVDRVLQLSITAAAEERMMRLMVPKLLAMANTYRDEDMQYAIQCQEIAKNDFAAWKTARNEERKRRRASSLQNLENDSTINTIRVTGREIDRRWNEVISMRRVSRRPPAIRMPGLNTSNMG